MNEDDVRRALARVAHEILARNRGAEALVRVGSFIIATEPIAADVMARLAPTLRMLTDTKKILYYFRPSPDGTRILFGGRAAFANNDQRVTGARLRQFLLGVWPELADVKITHRRTGNVAFTLDKLPHIGVQDGMHYAIGYCGSGVVKATYFGHKAGQAILGHKDAASPLMNRAFEALPLYDGTPWFLPLVALYYSLPERFAR